MSTSILLHNVSLEELKGFFEELQKQIDELKLAFKEKPATTITTLLTRQEVADFFKCDLSTVHNWTKKGKLIAHCKGHRVYYKLDEIEKSLTTLNTNQKRANGP